MAGTMPAMNRLAPFLWFNDNAEEAAEFYLSAFPHARRLDELRSKGVGPWPVGKIATITIELHFLIISTGHHGRFHAWHNQADKNRTARIQDQFQVE
jgi:predicted 3-demethylubiquinone-9 3-methyltransferase (glyoxalase superfamily)